ncbi:MAG: ribonucleoside-diphosphate reductase subunit alpha [Betaproteobacteria bacterium]|jgi:ribonucleoside-diphosphate reductase alpha chain|nr:ribonucleoside-diphosphate reductase subunit alpha [Betaproteobacteria bacterium]
MYLMKRGGSVVPFDADKIRNAVLNAFLYDGEGNPYHATGVNLSQADREKADQITQRTVAALARKRGEAPHVFIEDVQDEVELQLMRAEEHKVARGYVIFREKQSQKRAAASTIAVAAEPVASVNDGGVIRTITLAETAALIASFAKDLPGVKPEVVATRAIKDAFVGIALKDFDRGLLMAARERIEVDPDYSQLAARLQLRIAMNEVFGYTPAVGELKQAYEKNFPEFIAKGVAAELLDPSLPQKFDLGRLAHALVPERDFKFRYLGMQTLYDRYFLHIEETRIELPQSFFMRVAMGLAINEAKPNERAIEFYNVLSTFDYMTSTPTLFNAATLRPQLSSCYLTTISDDLEGIYEGFKENALLSKFAGGLGNDWTNVRGMGARIKGTNGKSQGIVPFLKVASDTAVAVNQGGKRKGAVCAYLESWHIDIEEFLELRKNTGDDRRRTHDMNTANWIPDLFMKRVAEGGKWTLLSPNDCPDLHDAYGRDFETRYLAYEAKAAAGQIRLHKTVEAKDLWRKMLSMLFETGHPWITFKDACNVRSPQKHVGVVHSSNLCTEITLNTNESEIAVCNLGSVNLVNHLEDGKLNLPKLQQTIKTAMRMLDNVIDINFYPVEKAKVANLRHRPVGLGVMGFHDALQILRVPYASQAAAAFADSSQAAICYFAYEASAALAEERGSYSTFEGSLWSKGVLPQDSLKLLQEERGQYIDTLTPLQDAPVLDWDCLRSRIQKSGMRNSNCVAIAPTATISNIIGVSAAIDPTYQNLFVKSNLSGEFTVVNEYLVRDLKRAGLWDEAMVADLKFFDGSVGKISRIPQELKALYATAFEIDPKWIIKAGAYRQKWIDQAQSLNVYMAGASGKLLSETYMYAWSMGLKTTYYLRTLSASAAEKSTGQGGELTAVSAAEESVRPEVCPIDGSCQACE